MAKKNAKKAAVKKTRHGKRADGKTQTSISLSEDILERARKEAGLDGRTFSNLVEQILKERYKDSTGEKK